MNVTGTIAKITDISENKPESKYKWKKRSVEVNGEWYGGFFDTVNREAVLAAQIGDKVKMSVSSSKKDGKTYLNFKEFKIVSKTAQPAAVAQQATNVAKPATPVTTVVPTNYRDYRITHAAAMNRACQVVSLALDNDAIKLPTKKEDKLEAIVALVEEIALDFATKNWNIVPIEAKEDSENEGLVE